MRIRDFYVFKYTIFMLVLCLVLGGTFVPLFTYISSLNNFDTPLIIFTAIFALALLFIIVIQLKRLVELFICAKIKKREIVKGKLVSIKRVSSLFEDVIISVDGHEYEASPVLFTRGYDELDINNRRTYDILRTKNNKFLIIKK